jgi:DNA-binding NtrC family response regulator
MSKIFIVDDDSDFLQACESILTNEGYEVETAGNVIDGEKRANEGGFDLIILDIMMEQPDDGISLAHRLKKGGLKTPIIMLSGISQVTGYSYGKCDETLPCVDFLEKPVRPDMLIEKVGNVLKQQ